MTDNDKNNEEELLTEQEVWDVLTFARALSTGLYGQTYLSPNLINARMRDINLNPRAATESLLETAMSDPKSNEDNLRKFSQDFELQSMVYKRLISYLSNMLSFDVTYISDAEPEDYSKPRYDRDRDRVEEFLDKFEYKKEFRIVVREMLRNDAYFGVFRDLDERYVLQEMPPEYCKITGRWHGGFLYSFDMNWFMQPGVDIDMYHDFFKKKYIEMTQGKPRSGSFQPTLSPELRGIISQNWVEVPSDVGVCFKLSPELATRLPYFTPLFNDLVLQSSMRELQKNANMASASKIIIGEVPMLQKEIKATVRDSLAISPDLLGKFLALVKNAVSESVNMASVPLNNVQGIEFEENNDLYDKYLRTALASSGINTNLIFSSDVKPNAIETQLSLNVDEQMMSALYEQFEDFMNYFINKKTTHFTFFISFEGTDFSVNREKRREAAMQLFNQGIVLPQKIAAAIGMKPHHLRKHMEETNATEFMKLLNPPSVQTQEQLQEVLPEPAQPSQANPPKVDEKTGEESKRGRPRQDLQDLDQEGVNTRETAGNVGRGGEIT